MARRSPAGRANLIATRCRITSRARLSASLAELCGSWRGRTDAGVHALAQCAHVDVFLKFLPADRWIKALNALLPSAVRVLRCRMFAEFSRASFGHRKNLSLQNLERAHFPPFEYRRAWHIARPLDLKVMKSAAKYFAGTHDFATFAANRGKPEPRTVRTLTPCAFARKVRASRSSSMATASFTRWFG